MPRRVETRFEMLSVPPAGDWQPFAQGIQGEVGKPMAQGANLQVDGASRWFAPDRNLISRLLVHPVYNLKKPLIIEIKEGANSYYANLTAGHLIVLNPEMTPEQANWVFIHELQHAYQEEEGRKNDDEERDWFLQNSQQNSQQDYQQRYREMPAETDADAMAQKLTESGIQFMVKPANPPAHQQPAPNNDDYMAWGQQAVNRLGLQ